MMSSLLIHTYRVVYRLVQLFLHLGKCQCQRSHNQAYLKHWTYLESGHWFRGWIPGEWNTISAYILGFVVYGSVKTSRKFVLFVWTTVEKLPCSDLRFYLTRSLFPRQCFDNLSGLNVREFMGKEESDLVLFWHKIKLSGTPYQSGEVKKPLGRGNIKASKTANSIAIDVVLLTTLLEIILQCMCLTMNLHEPLKPCIMGLFHLGDWNLRENYQAGIHDVSDLFFFFLPFLFLYLESSVPFMPIRQWNCNAECLSVWEIPLEQTKLSKMEQTVCFVPDDKIISDIHFS